MVVSEFEFTGFTKQGDDVKEWHDDEINQYGVLIDCEHRGEQNLTFYFDGSAEAHAFFVAVCEVKSLVSE